MKKQPFCVSCDVLVAGGGIAGVAAATAAGRAGLKTLLIEKGIVFGGLATSGLVLVYLPLSDARGKQVTFGLAEELLHQSLRYGPGDIPADWHDPNTSSRYAVRFSPAAFALALDEVLIQAGVELWLDTLITDAVVEKDRLIGVEVCNKSGKGMIRAKCFVDATGDADVAYLAGAPCREQDNWMSYWAIQVSLEKAREAIAANSGQDLCSSLFLGAGDNGQGAPPNMRKFHGTRGREVSEFVVEGRKLARDYCRREQAARGPDGRKDLYPVTLPSMAQFRTTRRIEGQLTLSTGDAWRHFDDSTGVVADWRGGRDLWELPYRALLPRNIKGLLTAGRCIGADGEAWQVLRVIPAAAMSGEVAGRAAALAVKQGITPDELDAGVLRRELEEHKFVVNINAIK